MTDELRPEDVGCCIHTALRKACDSRITSIAYNLVHAADVEWEVFLRTLFERCPVKFDGAYPEELEAAVTRTVEQMCPMRDFDPTSRQRLPRSDKRVCDSLPEGFNHSLFIALVLTFNEFDGGEWRAALSYLSP